MTEAVTEIVVKSSTFGQTQTQALAMTTVFLGGATVDPGSAITQTQADARYIKLAQINAANGVAGLDAGAFVGETNLPLPPVDLTVLLENKLA